ncbi:MAG: GntR family transcriptional regulator [Rhizobiales bacterium]|nr:GntR family transcriptional regulator [Hyphomicrobiales bacterium]MBI3671909.1 GntR family transcriptional regulator [Hyphomicrobiales bacterium]
MDLSGARLDRARPMRDQIYPMVRMLILTGAIKPGDAIDEKEIAAQLAVSRTPVREAVRKLSDENLVEVIAQSGTRAARIDRKEIEEAFLIRRALEVESAAQAARHMSAAQADRLEAILLLHGRAIARKSYVEAIERDDDFHRTITDISHLPRLWRAIEISKAQLDRCRHLMVPRAGQAEATLVQHRRVIKALASGDPTRAAKAMRDHLEAAYRSTLAVLDGPGLG